MPELAALGSWDRESINTLLQKYVEMHHIKSVMWAVRIGLAGQPVTPGGALEIMEILGKEESIKRLEKALNKL